MQSKIIDLLHRIATNREPEGESNNLTRKTVAKKEKNCAQQNSTIK